MNSVERKVAFRKASTGRKNLAQPGGERQSYGTERELTEEGLDDAPYPLVVGIAVDFPPGSINQTLFGDG